MSENIKHEVDTCGTCCPLPMISTLKVLARLQKGDRIKVIATDHGFIDDIETVARTGKCKIIELIEGDDFDTAIVEKL